MKKLLIALAMVVLTLTLLGAAPAVRAATTAGFNPVYIEGFGPELLFNANWTAANQAKVQAEINHMASMGTGIVRVMIWIESSGVISPPGNGSNRATFTDQYYEMIANFPQLIQMYQNANIKVDITFGNDWMSGGPSGQGYTKWWQTCWGNNSTGWNNFLTDSTLWVQGIVNSIEASPYAGAVLYYDIQNELSSHWEPSGTYYSYSVWYCAQIYDWGNIPTAKKGISINTDYVNDLNYLFTWFNPSRPLKFIDFHAYPASTGDAQYNVNTTYNTLKGRIPSGWGCTVVCGEIGYNTTSESLEPTQNQLVIGMLNKAKTASMPYIMAWTFNSLQACPNSGGYAFSKEWFSDPWNHPKDVMGAWAANMNMCSNADVETVSGGMPTGWTYGANYGPISGSSGGPSTTDACTGSYYYRLNDNTVGDDIYTLTPWVSVPGGNRLYVNAFVRSSCENVFLAFHEYDANHNWLRFQAGPTIQTPGWLYYNYQRTCGGWSAPLLSNTRYILLGACAHISSSPGYLDTDCYSISNR